MKRLLFYFFSFSLLLSINVRAQTITDSNLPLFVINTDGGASIVDNPRVRASLKILYRGPAQRNYLTDQNNPLYLNYDGRIDIEIRGSSSQFTTKKNYGFTTRLADNVTNNNVSLLNMPEENDWILNGMVFDPALMRDYLCYNLSRQIGEYASRAEYCELIINGEYKGLYMLQEKIKADDNRVDITRIGMNDNKIPELTGGYITKADKTTGGDPVAWTMKSWSGESVDYIHELPKPENVTASQEQYIHLRFTDLEVTALNRDVSVSGGFPSVIDIPSFIDYIVLSELGSNADAYQFSTFFHKDRNGKLRAGPIWDNDLTFGNDLFFWGLDRSKINGWQFSNGDNEGSRFWRDLILTSEFRCYLAKRWNELIRPGQPFDQEVIGAFIDQTVAYITEGANRDAERWGKTSLLKQQTDAIKSWLANRIPWITANLGSYQQCENVSLPPLVITKIMYHPAVSIEYPDEDKMEYLEITNNGDQTVDLEGVYFAGTGFVFQFPVTSSIKPFSSLILAGNLQVFKTKYGFTPFGQFTRNLSNKSENLVLEDAFGNIIDNVCYYDTIPWPDADGNGYYLKLIDPGLDNNNPSNWIASNGILTSAENPDPVESLSVYPNPADDVLKITAEFGIKSVRLLDIYGRLTLYQRINSESVELNVEYLHEGVYILEIESSVSTYFRKVIVR